MEGISATTAAGRLRRVVLDFEVALAAGVAGLFMGKTSDSYFRRAGQAPQGLVKIFLPGRQERPRQPSRHESIDQKHQIC